MTKYTIETYKDSAGEHRWRVRALNGQIVVPPEGYKNLADMMRTIVSLQAELVKIPRAIASDQA
jgi:uncharacterized protein YegP (UPF0339 family)